MKNISAIALVAFSAFVNNAYAKSIYLECKSMRSGQVLHYTVNEAKGTVGDGGKVHDADFSSNDITWRIHQPMGNITFDTIYQINRTSLEETTTLYSYDSYINKSNQDSWKSKCQIAKAPSNRKI